MLPGLPLALSDGDFTPQSKCLLGSSSAFFAQTSELNQVSFHSSIFPFLLFFKRSDVSTTPRLTSLPLFSIFLWNLTLYVFLSLITSSVFSLLLTSFPPHLHVLRCPLLPENLPSLCLPTQLSKAQPTLRFVPSPPFCFCGCPLNLTAPTPPRTSLVAYSSYSVRFLWWRLED